MLFYRGEKKEVRIEISSRDNLPFMIRNASYELIDIDSNSVESSGEVSIENREIFVIIQPSKIKGRYGLYFIYEIADEIIKSYVGIEVV